MPKASVLQAGFNTGEVSPLCYGAVDNPRYRKGLETCLNYLPTLQGPLIRRPGTKFVNPVKDSTNLPFLVPFKFSATQNYMLEFGDQYIRFYANNGQLITVGSSFKIQGGIVNSGSSRLFFATRANITPQQSEIIAFTSSVTPGATLELQSPYAVADLPLLRWAQNGDTLYLFHDLYPTYKLQRQTQTAWKISPVYFIDGPYLPANSYLVEGDNADVTIGTVGSQLIVQEVQVTSVGGGVTQAVTDPAGSGAIQITTTSAHGFVTGQNAFITGIVGTVEANNYSAISGSTNVAFWPVQVTSPTVFLLLGSVFVHTYISGGTVFPALFATSAAQAKAIITPQDLGRAIYLQMSGVRYWGIISGVSDAASINVAVGGTSLVDPVLFPATTTADQWGLGVWSGNGAGTNFVGNGYPSCGVFHQDRLVLAGNANSPQEVDASNTGKYETFSPSDPTTLDVKDSNSYSFNLNSEDLNPIRWMASTAQGLLAGTYASEWAMTPSGSSEALTPTNFNAQETSFFGSAAIAPVKIGNAALYVQRAARKLREMTFFFMAGTFRSSDLTEISEHITLPSLVQIEVQKETQPLIWGIRSDGALVSLVYNRDDVSLSAGWTRHQLGGRSDSAGTSPIVTSMAFIPDPLVTFDQMWLVVKRWINGAIVGTIEYMTKISDDSIAQEDSFQLDAGGTLNIPLAITGITLASPAVVTSAAHGLSNGNEIRISGVVGLNLSTTDINGNVTITNAVNNKTFVVAGATTNTFQLHDFSGNPVSSSGYSAWVSGGQVRRLFTTVSNLTWLEGETVGVLADGGQHPDCVVSSGGAITLNYPAAKVQIGYRYKSQAKLLRAEAGAADGTSIGKTRRTTRAAIQMHRVGDLSIGTSFNNLIPIQFSQADQNQADQAVPLFSGIIREGLESAYDFESQVCLEQSSPLPGTIQSITSFMEEQDL